VSCEWLNAENATTVAIINIKNFFILKLKLNLNTFFLFIYHYLNKEL